MNKKIITLSARNKAEAPVATVPASDNGRLVAAVIQMLVGVGYTLSAKLATELAKCSAEDITNFYQELSVMIYQLTGANANWHPIWPNFPNDAAQASKLDLYLVNFLNYITVGEWRPETKRDFAPALYDFSAAKVIDIAAEDEYNDIVKTWVMKNSPLSFDEKDNLRKALEDGETLNTLIADVGTVRIPQRETLAIVAAACIKSGVDAKNIMEQVKLPTDVMRIAAELSDYDGSLAESVYFASFKRSERRKMLELLDGMNDLPAQMAGKREEWKRFGERVHPGEFSKKYKNAYAAFKKLRSSEYIETYEGKLDKLIRAGEWVAAAKHLTVRAGLFARNIDMMLRKSGMDAYAVLREFAGVAERVDMRVLVQFMNHMRNRNNSVVLSAGRANGASSYAREAKVENIDSGVAEEAIRVAANAITAKAKSDKADFSKVYVSDITKDEKLPTNQRNAAKTLLTLPAGSRVKIENDPKVMRCFLHWDTKIRATDMDLSVIFYDKNMNPIETCSYSNPRPYMVGALHSGDVRWVTSGVGASEFVDFDIDRCKDYGVAYAVCTVNSYTGQMFAEMDSCFVGYMERDGVSGNLFEPKTVKNKFDLTSNARESIGFIVDIENMQVIMADKAIGSEVYSTAYGQAGDVSTVVKAIIEDKSMTVKEMLDKFVFANGGLYTKNPAEATLLITEEDVKMRDDARKVSPYDTASLAELLLG